MDQICEKANDQSFVTIPDIAPLEAQGIETGTIIGKLDDLCDALNAQAVMIDDWREQMVRDVLVPLLDETEEEKDKTGEEWQDSIDIQGKLEAYVKVLDAAISDREDAISGGTNARVEHELRVARDDAEAAVEEEVATEEDKTLLALVEMRNDCKPHVNLGSVRGAMSGLRQVQNVFGSQNTTRAHMEAEIASRQLRHISKQANKQSEVAKALHTELSLFSAAVKARMEFYNHLQQISDSLNPYDGPKDAATVARWEGEERRAEVEFRNAEMKQRYREYIPLVK
jgi:E3 ubiquitin-protein ligase SHPRH